LIHFDAPMKELMQAIRIWFWIWIQMNIELEN